MRRDTKRYKKASQNFMNRVSRHILDKGGRLAEPPQKGDLGIVLVINTPVGELKIHVYEDWIAQQFDDEKAAHTFTKRFCSWPSNPYSGKCNFHYPISKCVELECDTLERDWQRWLLRVLSGFPKFEHITEREESILRTALSYMKSNLDDLNEAYAECCEGEEALSFDYVEVEALQEALNR